MYEGEVVLCVYLGRGSNSDTALKKHRAESLTSRMGYKRSRVRRVSIQQVRSPMLYLELVILVDFSRLSWLINVISIGDRRYIRVRLRPRIRVLHMELNK